MLRKVTAAMLLCSMLGCYTVRPVATPSTFIPQRAPAVVWVADSSRGEMFQLLRPTMSGDSVTGVLATTSEPMTVPLTTNHMVFARQKSRSKTTQLIATLGVLGGFATWGLIVGSNGRKGCAQPGMRGCPPQ